MKKWIPAFLIITVCISAWGFDYSQLLDESDLEFQDIDNSAGNALGSALGDENPWESYNQWQCFELAQTQLTCADYDYGTLTPSMRVETNKEILYFDTYIEDHLDCQGTLALWDQLLGEDSREICIFAAHMPDIDFGNGEGKIESLWYIRRIKTQHGYWDLFDAISERTQ